MILNCSTTNKVKKIKPVWGYFMLKNQVIWLAKRIDWPKLKNKTVKLLEITELIPCFYMQPMYKNQYHGLIKSWHNVDSLLGLFLACLGEPDHTHLRGMNEINVFMYS